MGGSCCIPPKETETSDPQASSNSPRASEEPVLLSSDRGSASASSGGPRVDANLETSTPVPSSSDTMAITPRVDANLETSTPVPSSSDTMAITQTLLRAREISDNKTNASLQSANPNSVEDIASTSGAHGDNLNSVEDIASTSGAHGDNPNSVEDIASTSGAHGDPEETEPDSADDSENELQNVEEPVNFAEENDGCPICLEGYNAVNPKQSLQCGHHFHLACILDWRERRNNCPVCDRDIVFDPLNNLGL